MVPYELCDTGRVFAVDYRTVSQHQSQAGQCLIAVLRDTTAHAAGVVGDYTADLRRIDRGRIGADLALERRKRGIGVGTDDTWLQTDLRSLVADVTAVPVIAKNNQYRVTDSLAGQAGTGGAESHRHFLRVGQFEQLDYFCFGLHAYH
ncbi:hypothetical protein D9M69_480850 [compost metagenome]